MEEKEINGTVVKYLTEESQSLLMSDKDQEGESTEAEIDNTMHASPWQDFEHAYFFAIQEVEEFEDAF
ncbi:unnamed protein product [Moneuplotes crassus]|uniref:Uncharacterized protein n=1 Tax=Euplotes crassus TaxID=5936 RepID=A0AAD1Y8L1_EUPCR|nr:unnamed protein product [Moneuplotes crassus]